METRCEPSLTLHHPGSFRHVCPLLKQDSEGRWRCSVDTPQVRPFWLRAIAVFVASLLFTYLIGTLSVWGFLRWRGYPLDYAGIAWPPAWSQFHHAQSRYFATQANAALARNDVQAALMDLSVAYQTDRQNYALGRTFARLAQVGQPALSDRVYMQLATDHPARRAETLAAWYEALLWRADFRTMIDVTREALAADPAHASAWLNALVFSLRREPDDKALNDLAKIHPIPGAQTVVDLELQTMAPSREARAALLKPSPAGAPSYLEYYRPKRLIELGFAEDALTLLNPAVTSLPARDQIVLRLEAFHALGQQERVRETIESLIRDQLNSTSAELIAAYLIRHADPALFAKAFDAYKQLPIRKDEAAYRTWSGWMCAAGANRDFERFHEATAAMKTISGAEYRTLAQVEKFFRDDSPNLRIENYLPAMQPMPLEVTYALLERYYHPRAAVKFSP